MTSILAGNDPSQTPADVLQTLVGEGKKFKDHEALARGKVESDAFIEKLQEENRQMREELSKTMNLEQQLAALARSEHENKGGNHPAAQGNQPGAAPASSVDVEKLLDQKLSEREAAKVREGNLRTVDAFLLSHFGDANKAKDAIAEINASLGINLSELAAVSPAAVTKLIAGAQSHSGLPAERSTVGVRMPGQEVRNHEYYEKMRKEMGNAKFLSDRRLQVQLHKDAQSLGDAFYQR